MVPTPAHRPVLLVWTHPEIQGMLRDALSVPSVDAWPVESLLRDKSIASFGSQPSLPQFTLVSVEMGPQVLAKFAEAQAVNNPFALVVIEGRSGEWEIVRDLIEELWKYDQALRCIFCLPSDRASWPHRLVVSRPEQWAVLRIPFLGEEAFQLASCLSLPLPKPVQPPFDRATDSAEIGSSSTPSLDIDDTIGKEATGALESARGELAASRYYVENILRSMADSLLVINADMTIGAVNPSLLNLLGYQEDDLIGQSPGLIFGEEFSQGAIIENLLLQGSVSGVESSFLTHEGEKITISVSGSMMQDLQGQFQGLVCVAQDITERKRMEEEKLQLHEQLMETSRQLGMAEVATGVLHNVGNVLNSINVSIGVITDLLKNSMVGDVGRISELLDKHREDLGRYLSQNPKGKQVPHYLGKLSEQLKEEQRVALLELERLRENAGHAQQCVAVQQDLAKPGGMTERVCVAEVIAEALTVNQKMLEETNVSVIQEFQEVPQLIVEKHQLLQILVDVIRNACQAMESAARRHLIVRIKLIIGPPDSLCLEVQDTGSGIPPDDITKIFGQGYSTKYGGRGLSLHHGALMAKNMGGALRAQSEGMGQGATFFLDLPGNFHFPDL
ncbi:PAS domain S-box protein [Candidatus Nitrospira allomarina]|uniref:histidine kinase n=1 Tax=Candidatus Nitrospira allomarina TaxID=3020900 RepID=A0AA96GKS4_9BACT|nr:PAS domain S-box protein [Candidatus Nitrospira allomarina]WNM59381.1 PAS domain S-box protein [Candidatus Nitrospira allomarina]